MKGRQIRYSDAELAFIEWRQSMTRRALHAAFVVEFGRVDVKLEDIKALCSRRKWTTGRSGCFEKGMPPLNKGKRCPPGTGGNHPNARKSHFKAGGVPPTAKWLGHERITKDGYVEISVAETNPHTGYGRRHVLKHRWLWEKDHGPIPKGKALKSRDGNRQNTDPSNWFLISRSLLPRLGGRYGRDYDHAPQELKPAILATAQLEQKVCEVSGRKRKGASAR